MKEAGKIGSDLVATLADNSESFAQKTRYSQAKFLRKKAKKYFEVNNPCM